MPGSSRTKALGKSGEDYLEAILILNRSRGWCREVDIAGQMGYSRPSVSIACTKLEAEGYITKEDTGEIRLTEAGRAIAERTLDKHEFFRDWFIRTGIPPEKAEDEACLVEHAISDGSFASIRAYIERLEAQN